LVEFFSTVQAIASPKKLAPVDFNILINSQHLIAGWNEKAAPESGFNERVICNFFPSESLFHACEHRFAQDLVHFLTGSTRR
jgi:hypothetical protein